VALISLISEEKAYKTLGLIYSSIKERMGFIPNSLKLFAQNQGILANTLKIFESYAGGSNINANIFPIIRYAVAHAKGSTYCINMNSKVLKKYGFDESLVDSAHGHWTQFPISEKEKELIGFAVKVATDAENVCADDVDRLKNLGWSEKDIYTASDQGARMLYGSALLKAFKVELD